MFKTLGTAAILAMTAASVAYAEPIRVATVEVTAEFSEMGMSALEYWPNLEADVGTAVAALVTNFPGKVPFDVTVRIEELGLDGSPILSGNGEFNYIKGRVIASPEGTTAPVADFAVELYAATALPAGASPNAIMMLPVEGEFYVALVNAFAARVAETLSMLDSETSQMEVFEDSEPSGDDAAEVPATEAPAEEAPAEEVPAEEMPVEETPAEDVPADDAPAEGDADTGTDADAGTDTDADAETGSDGTETEVTE